VYATVHYKSKEIKTTQWSAVKENVKTEKKYLQFKHFCTWNFSLKFFQISSKPYYI